MKVLKATLLKSQSGRSMIEMLGVLAIIGVLSVGALAGYSTAMTNYKANEAIEEIKHIIWGIKDLYSGKNNYDGITDSVLVESEVIPSDRRNVFDRAMGFTGGTYFRVVYPFTDEAICQKILLAGWDTELGNDLVLIYVWHNSIIESVSGTNAAADYHLPMQVSDATTACEGITQFIFHVY